MTPQQALLKLKKMLADDMRHGTQWRKQALREIQARVHTWKEQKTMTPQEALLEDIEREIKNRHNSMTFLVNMLHKEKIGKIEAEEIGGLINIAVNTSTTLLFLAITEDFTEEEWGLMSNRIIEINKILGETLKKLGLLQ